MRNAPVGSGWSESGSGCEAPDYHSGVPKDPPTEELTSARALAWWVGLAFLGSNLYYAHRWLFRYNSSSTSLTYTDTPFVWKATKYVLLAAVTMALSGWLVWQHRRSSRTTRFEMIPSGGLVPLAGAWFLLLAGSATFAFCAGYSSARVSTFAFLPIVLALSLAVPTPAAGRLAAHLGIGLITYHAVFTAVQLGFFLVEDRLPALASGKGSLNRFGGGLDDPNGFAMIMVLPVLLTVTLWHSFPRPWMSSALAAVCCAMLALAISFSAIIGLFVGLLVLPPLIGRMRLLIWITVGGAVVGTGLLAVPYARKVVSLKKESALKRLDLGGGELGLEGYLDELTGWKLLFGAPGQRVISENGYVLVFTGFGLIGLIGLVAAISVGLHQGWVTVRRARAAGLETTRRTFEALTAYVVAVSVASLGVPYFRVFPTNMLFWTVLVVVALGPAVVDHLATAPPVDDTSPEVQSHTRSDRPTAAWKTSN